MSENIQVIQHHVQTKTWGSVPINNLPIDSAAGGHAAGVSLHPSLLEVRDTLQVVGQHCQRVWWSHEEGILS